MARTECGALHEAGAAAFAEVKGRMRATAAVLNDTVGAASRR